MKDSRQAADVVIVAVAEKNALNAERKVVHRRADPFTGIEKHAPRPIVKPGGIHGLTEPGQIAEDVIRETHRKVV